MVSKEETHLTVYDYCEMSFEYMLDGVNSCHECAKQASPVLNVMGPAWKGNSIEKFCCNISHLSPEEIKTFKDKAL